MESFREAVRNRREYRSPRFLFQGYDGSLWCYPEGDADISAGFSKEFRNCGNGYYYMLVNDDTLMGYDVD